MRQCSPQQPGTAPAAASAEFGAPPASQLYPSYAQHAGAAPHARTHVPHFTLIYPGLALLAASSLQAAAAAPLVTTTVAITAPGTLVCNTVPYTVRNGQ